MDISNFLVNPISLLGSLLPSYAVDVVGVYDEDYNQVFTNARPMKATINKDSKMMEHPTERGLTKTDFKVIQPIEIQLSMLLVSDDLTSVYRVIDGLFNASTKLIVQTRSGIYTNMIIKSMPHDETVDVYGGLIMSLSLKEMKEFTAKYEDVKTTSIESGNTSTNAKTGTTTSASTTNKGAVSSKTASSSTTPTAKKGSILFGALYS